MRPTDGALAARVAGADPARELVLGDHFRDRLWNDVAARRAARARRGHRACGDVCG